MDFQKEQDFEVQKILGKKVFNGKTLYLVKWKNYPIEQATWQCNKLLLNVKQKIREFKYSKRENEFIPDIKTEEEEFAGKDVKDSFKRKRGRPPKINFSSYRTVVTNSGLNKDNNTQNFQNSQPFKRSRGRPRGSKNKKVIIEQPSEQSFQSQTDTDSSTQSQNQIQLKNIEDISSDSQLQTGKKNAKKQKKMSKANIFDSSSEVVLDILETSDEDIPKNSNVILDKVEESIKPNFVSIQQQLKTQVTSPPENSQPQLTGNAKKNTIINLNIENEDNLDSLGNKKQIQGPALNEGELQSLQQLLQNTMETLQLIQKKLNIFSKQKTYNTKETQTNQSPIQIEHYPISKVSKLQKFTISQIQNSD